MGTHSYDGEGLNWVVRPTDDDDDNDNDDDDDDNNNNNNMLHPTSVMPWISYFTIGELVEVE